MEVLTERELVSGCYVHGVTAGKLVEQVGSKDLDHMEIVFY